MKGQVPRREPRVLPLVGHRDDVARDHVEPRDVAHRAGGGVRVPRVHPVLAQPAVHVVLVVLLAPQQPGQRLAHHHRRVGRKRRGDDRRVELVGLVAAGLQHLIEVGTQRVTRCRARGQAHTDRGALARPQLQHVVGGHLGARAGRIDRVGVAPDDEVVDRVLDVRRGVRGAEEALVVGLVLAEQQLRRGVGAQQPLPQLRVRRRARRRRPRPSRRASRPRRPTTTCCETRASGAGAATPRRGRGCAR